jgi:type I restriction enzyme S subunit
MSDISVIARGGSPRPIQQYLTEESDGVNWIKIGDANGKYINSTQQKIKPEGVSRSRLVHKGDFLLTNSMSFGKPYILNIDGCIHDGWLVISPMRNSFDKEFLYYLLSSDFAYYQFSKVAGGAVVSNLNSDKVADTFVPMPPIREQINIVKAIEKWFSILDEIECTKSNLSLLIANAKSKILDLAIAGKLVPQSASDEPAIEALRRINPSFQPCDNPQYEQLPKSWAVAKIGDVYTINPRNSADDKTEAGFIPMTNIHDGYNNSFSFELRNWGAIKTGFTHFRNGDIVVAKISPCLENRKSAVISGLPNGIGAGTTELHVFRQKNINPLYGLMFFKTNNFIQSCTGSFNGAVGQQRVSTKVITDLEIPIPPIAEQQRIVDKVNELFTILDSIQNSLDAN